MERDAEGRRKGLFDWIGLSRRYGRSLSPMRSRAGYGSREVGGEGGGGGGESGEKREGIGRVVEVI